MASLFQFLGGGPRAQFVDLIASSKPRKDAAEKRLLFYRDCQAEHLFKVIAAKWSKPESFRLFQINAVKKIINRRATVYVGKPIRTFEGMDQAAGEQLYRDLGADLVLKTASRLTKLLKTCALQVMHDGTRLRLAVIPSNVLDAEWADPDNPTRLVVTHLGERAELTEYSDWTSTSFTRRDWRGNPISVAGNPDGTNPYGILPFVPLFDYAPVEGEFFLTGGDDLIEAQEAINVALTNLWRAIELQSHGQAWASGLPTNSTEIPVGPDKTINLPENGEFGFAQPNAPIEQVLSALEFVLKQTAVMNDLSANTFEIQPLAESGTAKEAERRDLIEARQDDLELWRGYETKLFEVIKVVANTHAPGSVPEDATVRVDFAEIDQAISENERLDSYQKRLDMGIASPVDILMAENPDIRTREEALELLLQQREEAAQLGQPFALPPTDTGGDNGGA